LAAPILYERDLVGLVEVFSTAPYAFDDGDLAVVERLAQTVVLTLSRAEVFKSSC
jgi:GAF domain-containing protein